MLEGFDSPSESRALVVIEPEIVKTRICRAMRSDSAFVAHLIAMAEQVPQLREKRRAEPGDAIAVYRAAINQFSVQ